MWKVYKITCKTYHDKAECYKSYIGITINTVEKRFEGHCTNNNNSRFGLAIKKYGKDDWILEILEDDIKTDKEALERETFYIDKYNTFVAGGKGYNVVRHSQGRLIVNGKLICYSCDEWQPVETFSKNINAKCGYGAWCKDCRKEYYLINSERIKLNCKTYREDNPEWLAKVRLNYKSIKQEKDKISSENISAENSLLSIDELYLKTPNKYCFGCETIKLTTEFPRRNCVKDGFYAYCRECKRKKDNDSYYKNKTK